MPAAIEPVPKSSLRSAFRTLLPRRGARTAARAWKAGSAYDRARPTGLGGPSAATFLSLKKEKNRRRFATFATQPPGLMRNLTWTWPRVKGGDGITRGG